MTLSKKVNFPKISQNVELHHIFFVLLSTCHIMVYSSVVEYVYAVYDAVRLKRICPLCVLNHEMP